MGNVEEETLRKEFIDLIEGMGKEASLKAAEALGPVDEATMNKVMVKIRAVNFPEGTTPDAMTGSHVVYIPGVTEQRLAGLPEQLKPVLPGANINADVVKSLHSTYLFARQEWDPRLNTWLAQQANG